MDSVFDMLIGLSALARTGWMLRGIPSGLAENVAEHSYWSAVLAFEISVEMRKRGSSIDPYRAAVIALFHDVGESVIGDIPKTAGIDRREKMLAEKRAVESLPISDLAKSHQFEFDSETTLEAVIARIAEIMATYARAVYYEQLGYNVEDIKNNMYNYLIQISEKINIIDIISKYLKLLNE